MCLVGNVGCWCFVLTKVTVVPRPSWTTAEEIEVFLEKVENWVTGLERLKVNLFIPVTIRLCHSVVTRVPLTVTKPVKHDPYHNAL